LGALRGFNSNNWFKSKSSDPLSEDILERAWFHRGDTTRLERVMRRIALEGDNQEPIRIAVLGGSMTQGHETKVPWADFFLEGLREQYPSAPPIIVFNMGLGSSHSVFALHSVVPAFTTTIPPREKPPWSETCQAWELSLIDVVIIDYGVNDAHIKDEEAAVSTEGIINYLNGLPSKPAIVYYDTFRTLANDADGSVKCDPFIHDGAYTIQRTHCSHQYHVSDTHSLVTVPGGVPVVSYRNVPWPAFDDSSVLDSNRAWWDGPIHPHEETHKLVAEVLVYAWRILSNELLCKKPQSARSEPTGLSSRIGQHNSRRVCQNRTDLLHHGMNQNVHRNLLSKTGIKSRDFYHQGSHSKWSFLLDYVLGRALSCEASVTIAAAVGNMGASTGQKGVMPWPLVLQDVLDGALGKGCVRILFVAKSPEEGLQIQTEPYAFQSSLNLSYHFLIESKSNSTSNHSIYLADLIVVDMASSDGAEIISDMTMISATQRIISSIALHNSNSENNRFHRDYIGLLYFDTFYKASNHHEASVHCGRVRGRRSLRSDPNMCAAYYYASNNHDQATIPSGVPVISYRYAVWPFLDNPPPEKYMASIGFTQPQHVHNYVGRLIAGALLDRARNQFKCLNSTSKSSDRLMYFANKEREQGICGLSGTNFMVSPTSGGLKRLAVFNLTDPTNRQPWNYFEDFPGKPGWIFEGLIENNAEISFELQMINGPPLYNIGYMRSYGCWGKVQVWAGTLDPWRLNGTAVGSCGIVLDAHWSGHESLYETTAFTPEQKCIIGTGTGKRRAARLSFRPIPSSDAGIPGCNGTRNKFKLEFIEGCQSAA
jgi:hypothetical protein